MKKLVLAILGFIFLTLGAVGIVIPLLPTTPLVLFAAICFSSCHKGLETWLLESRLFGPFIENYRTGQGISKKRKIASIAFLWAGLTASMIILHTLAAIFILLAIGISVTIHILMIKSKT
ncbi:MAG: YbaN family protein [Lachnospiraceae bacterium]|nr:YbaN family protein [Lachnospiraceae bacterium]